MADNKKGFILYADQKELFDQLPDDKAGELIKHIFAYVNDENPQTDDLYIKLAFTPIKQQLKRDLIKFEATKEQRSNAGKRSAELRKIQRDSAALDSVERDSTKATVIVNDNVTDTVNVIKEVDNTPTKVDGFDFSKLLEFINKTYEGNFRVINKTTQAKYKARLKDGYTKDDILNAIVNCKNDSFHKEHNYKYCTPLYFSKDKTLDMYRDVKEVKSTNPQFG